ncbi:MAG: glycosyltransferase family 39 protein, partial [Methanoregulaceae archaeon]
MIHLIDREFITKYRAEILLCGILALSAFLNLWNIWNQGITNSYYAAAVKSMLVNPGIAFFNSFDPAGFVTVDKPPVGLWVQAAFAAVLGFSGWVLVLPQALAGVGSVALIYLIVSRPFGKTAGLVSALALAVTPILVAVSRNGTMDTQLIFVLLLAVWVALKAARERSLPWFLISVVLLGIGFNIKMIQAYIAVPAVLAVYFLGTTDFAWKKRILHVGLAIVVLLAVSLSWAVAVDTIPADQRPYIGGSGDNTVLGLIVNYNGLHRLESDGMGGMGGSSGTGGPGTSATGQHGLEPGSMAAAAGQAGSSFTGPGGSQGTSGSTSGTSMGGSGGSQGGVASSGQGPGLQQASSGIMSGSSPGGGGMNDGGSPGIFRLFGEGLAGQISWLLAFALIGILAWARKPDVPSLKGLEEAGFMSEKGLTLIAMLLWLIPGLLYFSFTTGFWHTYYIATIAPPIAGLVGIGAAGLYRKYLTGDLASWLLVIALLVTGLLQALFLSYDAEWSGPLVPVIIIGTLLCAGLLAGIRVRRTAVLENHRTHIACIAISILFIAPFVWSCTPLMYGSGNILPTAGPQGSRGGGSMPGGSTLSGMAGMGGPGISGMDNSSFARNMPDQNQLDRQGNNTRFSD